MSTFYKNLRELCEQNGITVTELASSLKMSSGSPTAWKNGAIPRQKTLDLIADHFDVSTNRLLQEGLSTCPVCGLYYDSSYQPDVKEHSEFHKTFCKAVEYFGDACCCKKKWGSIKSLAYDILGSDEYSQDEKSDALLELIKTYFSRSLYECGYSLDHPKFEEYTAMILNQERFKILYNDAYNILLKEYGKKPGIPEGETTYKILDIMNFDKKQKPAPVSGDELSDVEKQILENYRSLNAKGQQKLLEYSDDLATCGNYFKNTSCSQNA